MIDLGNEILDIHINLHWKDTEIEDLRDDIVENFDKHFYEFIDNNPEKAFYTGFLLSKMLYDNKSLEIEQYLLYSREFRHLLDDLDKYDAQFKYFQDKYNETHEKATKLELFEYLLNNLFYDNLQDCINISARFGAVVNK